MIYNGQLTPPTNWPPLIRYPSYRPDRDRDRRLSTLWFLVLTIVSLSLSVIALIIVFAVESAWFRDNFSQNQNRYGLWRLCSFNNNTCDSWFSSSGPFSRYVEQRLNQSKGGINAWQALEIIFLFLTTATLITTIASFACYRCQNSFHYYLALLAIFCIWLAASIGISSLFVFGFAVFNVATVSRDLDWCFYLNLVAVILVILAAILLSIYDVLLRKPIKNIDDDTVVETFADFNGYPATFSPSTFVIVRRNEKKRNKPYNYSRVLHPNHYFPTTTNGVMINGLSKVDYTVNPNRPPLAPYTSIATINETINTNQQQTLPPLQPYERSRSNMILSPSPTNVLPTIQQISRRTEPFEVSPSPYPYQTRPSPPNWHRTGTSVTNQSIGYASEPAIDYTQRDYYPPRSNTTERRLEPNNEPRLLHYYTGYDYFATLDPSDLAMTRHHPTTTATTLGGPIRYGGNPSYHPPSDYIKSTL
ncbi:unnamed protein product [Rotaria magnacalcarata]|uniref:Uncharacterized protein n=2 Tax=Rotaria magnacalcarata TaxID=392030 RepID=A0A819BMX2_9BILA|nr:unnamed protein product [Rotaria magnacalcarata]CAF2217656.1 unnamed protein product [Rotaria magnacalcarata]CAF3769927.1 unnamed protein product [Rotaria magnacalcarata]CAF3799559.1 unnamed protein product [Rotaria magnacalcarata]